MNKYSVKRKVHESQDGWYKVLEDARVKLHQVNARAKELRAVIRQIEDKVSRGERFPVEDASAQ